MKKLVRRVVISGVTVARRARESTKYRRKIRAIQRSIGTQADVLPEAIKHDARQFLAKLSEGYRYLGWHELYSAVSGRADWRYVPEDLFYSIVEPTLNPRDRVAKYRDKNSYGFMKSVRVPPTSARIVRGRLLGPDFEALTRFPADSANEFVFKPARASGGGRGIVFAGRDAAVETARILCQDGGDYIVQPCIEQAEAYRALNQSSLNTLRVVTLRLDSAEVVLLSTVVRMGRALSRVDNQASGGLSCGVVDGHLVGKAVDKSFATYANHPDSGVEFDGYELPGVEAAHALCVAGHRHIFDLDLVSWDVAIDSEGQPILIEINVAGQEVNFHQNLNGPLFGLYTEEVVSSIVARTRGLTVLGVTV